MTLRLSVSVTPDDNHAFCPPPPPVGCRRDLIGAWRTCPHLGVSAGTPSVFGFSASDQEDELIVIGVDPHKATHTAGAVNELGKQIATLTVPARQHGFEKALAWGRRLDTERRWALEDCRHVSGSFERFLLTRGEAVVRVPPKLMAGARTSSRTFGKSDDIDAFAVARAALRETELPAAQMAGVDRDLKLLVDHREDLVGQRGAIQQRLRWHLHDIDPEIEVPERALDRKVWLDKVARKLQRKPNTLQVEIAKELLGSCRQLTRRVDSIGRQIERLVGELCPELLALPGCGHLTAAKLFAEVAGIGRFSTEAKLAVHAGVAPLEASSGARQRHRLNRHGNRQLNVALHRIAVTQGRIHQPAKVYLDKKKAEGKNRMEALRCLKRHLAGVVFRLLKAIERRAILDAVNGQAAPQTALGLT